MRILCGSSLNFLSVGVALLLPACTGTAPVCSASLSRMMEAQVFFGDNIGGGVVVTADQWQEFMDSEVTPRFPAGFTVVATAGQWRRADGGITRESSHELVIVFARTVAEENKLNDIRSAYMRRFMQESVLLAEAPVCAGF